jgi:hypothetical protein
MKTVGIACDNYKISKYEAELTLHDLTDYKIIKLMPKTSLIQVKVKIEQVEVVQHICQKLEAQFQAQKN